MAIEVKQKDDAGAVATGDNPGAEFEYIILGASDDVEARAALEDFTEDEFDPWGTGLRTIPRVAVEVKRIADDVHEGYVRYGAKPAEWMFDTTGGTQHITHSLATVARYGAKIWDTYGALGIHDGIIDGCDIVVPTYQSSMTYRRSAEQVNKAYRQLLMYLTGKVNSELFLAGEFEPGECLFLGARGYRRGDEDWTITFNFAARKNVTGRQVGDIIGIDVRGWDMIEVYSEPVLDIQGQTISWKPVMVTVEQVYEYEDLNALGV